MSKEQINEGNKIIHLFLGATIHKHQQGKKRDDGNEYFQYHPIDWQTSTGMSCPGYGIKTVEQLMYHCDWNWIIPAIKECIKRLGMKSTGNTHIAIASLWGNLVDMNIKGVYKSLLEGIKLLNETK